MAEQVVVQGRQKNTTRQMRCVVPRYARNYTQFNSVQFISEAVCLAMRLAVCLAMRLAVCLAMRLAK